MHMQIGEKGLALIKTFEGFRARAYRDAVGIWTIGWGHTRGVRPGMTVTGEEATTLLLEDLQDAEDAVNAAVRVPLTEGQFDALVSLTFNIGCGAFRKSTLLRVLNQKRYADVPAQFMRWDKAGGRALAGLTRRRRAEAALWRELPDAAPVIEETNARPDAPVKPVPLAATKTTLGTGAIAVAGVGSAAKAVSDNLDSINTAAASASTLLTTVGPWAAAGLVIAGGAAWVIYLRNQKLEEGL